MFIKDGEGMGKPDVKGSAVPNFRCELTVPETKGQRVAMQPMGSVA